MDQSDYISQLNLEYIPSSNNDITNDLASFTDSSFFDFDQFNQDLKLQQQQQSQPITELSSESFSYLEKFVDDNTKSLNKESTTILNNADKKKRNTAASARFRIKKKLREQEMERNLKELNEKIASFNARIQQLEMENSCLKSLIVQKNEQKSNDLLKRIKEKSLTN